MTHTGRIAACLFLICIAGPLFAGAWQREPGTGFASLTQRRSVEEQGHDVTWTAAAGTPGYFDPTTIAEFQAARKLEQDAVVIANEPASLPRILIVNTLP